MHPTDFPRAHCAPYICLWQFPLAADEAKTRLSLADDRCFELAGAGDAAVLAGAAVELEFTIASRQRADAYPERQRLVAIGVGGNATAVGVGFAFVDIPKIFGNRAGCCEEILCRLR